MRKSGARLVEVGTTNRTHVDDYERALERRRPAIILKVHRSNFALSGFVAEASASELAALGARARRARVARSRQRPVDSRSTSTDWPASRRRATRSSAGRVDRDDERRQAARRTAGRESFSARARIIDRIRKNPLTRSYRVDKLTLAALEATLALYREPARAMREIPGARAAHRRLRDAARTRRAAGRGHRRSRASRSSRRRRASAAARSPRRRFRSAALAISDAPAEPSSDACARRRPADRRRASPTGRVILDLRTMFVPTRRSWCARCAPRCGPRSSERHGRSARLSRPRRHDHSRRRLHPRSGRRRAASRRGRGDRSAERAGVPSSS